MMILGYTAVGGRISSASTALAFATSGLICEEDAWELGPGPARVVGAGVWVILAKLAGWACFLVSTE